MVALCGTAAVHYAGGGTTGMSTICWVAWEWLCWGTTSRAIPLFIESLGLLERVVVQEGPPVGLSLYLLNPWDCLREWLLYIYWIPGIAWESGCAGGTTSRAIPLFIESLGLLERVVALIVQEGPPSVSAAQREAEFVCKTETFWRSDGFWIGFDQLLAIWLSDVGLH